MKKLLVSLYRKIFGIFSGHGIGMVFPIRQANDFVVSRLRQDFVEINGQKMFLDSLDSLHLSTYGTYDALETALVQKNVKKGDVVIDIGAHIGYYTLLFAKLAGESGKVYAFEPSPANFALLKKNVKTNGYKNVVLEQKAVSNKAGKIRMYLNDLDRTLLSMFDLHGSKNSFETEAIVLDEYMRGRRVDFIKMDIEGAEYLALKGMRGLLAKNKKIKMILEFGPEMLKKSETNPGDLLEFLEKSGFRIFEIDEEKKGVLPVAAAALLEKYPLEKLEKMPARSRKSTNLFCVKE